MPEPQMADVISGGERRRSPTHQPPTEPEQQASDILRNLRRILRAVTLESKRLARESGLTLPQVAALRALLEVSDEGVTVVSLARRLETSPPTMTGIVDRLERAGLVTKERSQRDRRKVLVQLTDEGREKTEALPAHSQDKFVDGVLALDEPSRSSLNDALETILRSMEADRYDAAPILAVEISLDDPADEPY